MPLVHYLLNLLLHNNIHLVYKVRIQAVDQAGNLSTPSTVVTVQKDTKPPTVGEINSSPNVLVDIFIDSVLFPALSYTFAYISYSVFGISPSILHIPVFFT